MGLEKLISRAMVTDVHSASKTIQPDTPIPLKEFLEEVQGLDF
jgi:hypothetical protein